VLNTCISLEYPEGQPLRERIRTAVKGEDAAACGKFTADLRARGFNYSGIYRLVSNITGIGAAEWDALLYEADELASRSVI